MFAKAKLQGWIRVIVRNTFQMYKDIMVKLSDWERYLRVWNIWTPRKQIESNIYKSRLIGMGQSDSLEHLPDVHRHQGEAE